MLKKSPVLLFFLAAGIVLSGCSQADPDREPEVFDKSDIAMGTVVMERIYSQGEDRTSEVLDLLSQTEHRYLSWREEDSDIGRVNL